jgi:hypothetical protein
MFNGHLFPRTSRGRYSDLSFGNSLSSFPWFSRGRESDLLGLHSRHSRYGYECESCVSVYGGRHLCTCAQLEAQVATIEEYQARGIGVGCDCPDCPYEDYGYGLFGGGGLSQ